MHLNLLHQKKKKNQVHIHYEKAFQDFVVGGSTKSCVLGKKK